jgi:collagenase-like PrtC family protease
MKTVDWQELVTTSHYQTAVAIRDALQEGNVDDATIGLEELIDALSRSDARALRSHLVRLMQHVIKWRLQPQYRSQSWVATIAIQRQEIADLQAENPRFTEAYIRERLWDRCVQLAVKEAERDMNQAIPAPPTLSWDDVFETDYQLDPTSQQ